MDFFGGKRNYRFKSGRQVNEQRMFWIIAIVLSLIFMLIYHFNS
jgi:hypothetical protein